MAADHIAAPAIRRPKIVAERARESVGAKKETATARDLLTVRDAAKRLAIHPETCRRLIRQGRIPAVQVGGSVRVDPVELEQWIYSPGAEFRGPGDAA